MRVCALDTLTSCLCLVKDLPRNDANIFPEYVLPSIAPLATDSSVVVRIAYARNVGKYKYSVSFDQNIPIEFVPTCSATLAETAVYFLDQTQLNASSEMPAIRYEIELSALHEMLHQTVSHLLTDSQPIVKQTLMECGITKLCVFFGRQKGKLIADPPDPLPATFTTHLSICSQRSGPLAYDHLLERQRGQMLARLIFRLHRWRCGVRGLAMFRYFVATTPARAHRLRRICDRQIY